ncbi:hypothetical protein [Chryseobacterium sp. HMWF035]|uniref:hypothetical protein n=1 Tax=Chryseobacterium sp. HMWF035 TaxID=2056868 RepID=UPI000D5853AB|nr:hypothetical protein [Chryseobacterium sp. HMWF035]PVV54800.1 hypothetical protein DD829_16400 [Chryseobacterium sp. HMWF035]
MKKKLIIGALALTSILAFAQEKGGSSSSETGRRFWGSETIGSGNCSPTGEIQADGTAKCECEVYHVYYVMWIAVDTYTTTEYTAC